MIEQIYTYFTIEMIYFWLNIGVVPFWLILILCQTVNTSIDHPWGSSKRGVKREMDPQKITRAQA